MLHVRACVSSAHMHAHAHARAHTHTCFSHANSPGPATYPRKLDFTQTPNKVPPALQVATSSVIA